MGAEARNYTPVTSIARTADGWAVGARTADGELLSVQARNVVNLAGPWVDQVAGLTGVAPRMVATTRGGHVVVRLPERFRGHGVMTLSGLDHPFYCFPFRDRHFLGPTEAPDNSDPDSARTSGAERGELLAEAARQLPGLQLTCGDVLGSWAGMRPLTLEPKTMMAARNRVIHDLPGAGGRFLSLTNGSIGAHQITAQDILGVLGHERPAAKVPVYTAATDPVQIARDEQVMHLEDMIWRRMGLAWEPEAGLDRAADLARRIGPELGWDDQRIAAEAGAWQARATALGLADGPPA